MLETSGRDISMFKYVDHIFPDGSSSSSSSSSSNGEHVEYNKLVIHFTINDIKYAEASVDGRMLREMNDGQTAISSNNGSGDYLNDIINVNAGGPYGSSVLRSVQEDSDRVWANIDSGDVGSSWYKATIHINGHDDPSQWTASSSSNNNNNINNNNNNNNNNYS